MYWITVNVQHFVLIHYLSPICTERPHVQQSLLCTTRKANIIPLSLVGRLSLFSFFRSFFCLRSFALSFVCVLSLFLLFAFFRSFFCFCLRVYFLLPCKVAWFPVCVSNDVHLPGQMYPSLYDLGHVYRLEAVWHDSCAHVFRIIRRLQTIPSWHIRIYII